MKLKKILTGALAAVVAVGSLSIAVFAETDASGDFEYEVLDDGTIRITDYLSMDTDVVIPAAIDGKDVTVIGDRAFASKVYIVTVEIPDSITTIEDYAFFECGRITEIVLPDSVTTIGDNAFSITGLTEIVIPKSVTKIGDRVFQGCSSLTSITVAENNTSYASVDGVLFDKKIATLIKYPEGKHGTEYSVPDSVTAIGLNAFCQCESLTKIVIPEGVTAIGMSAFGSCVSLTDILIPEGVTTIGDSAFSNCTSLTEFVIPDSVTTIGEGAFSYCTSLTEIMIPDSVTTIEPYALQRCTSLIEIVIPNSATTIGLSAFRGCTSLTEIVFPDSVTTIGWSALHECSSLRSLTFLGSDIDLGILIFMPEKGVLDDETILRYLPENLTIYGYIGSTAEAFAKEYEEYGINFVALDEDLSTPNAPSTEDTAIEDKETGIKISAANGVLPENAVLNVELDKENSDPSSVAFDITLTADGKPAAINGTVTVTIPVPDELKGADTYYVFYQDDNGNLTDMKATYKDGVITFTTTHFSTYIVSTVNLLANKGDSPNTGIEGVAIVAGIAIVAAASVVISKKRK